MVVIDSIELLCYARFIIGLYNLSSSKKKLTKLFEYCSIIYFNYLLISSLRVSLSI